jgi:hypothetical protein
MLTSFIRQIALSRYVQALKHHWPLLSYRYLYVPIHIGSINQRINYEVRHDKGPHSGHIGIIAFQALPSSENISEDPRLEWEYVSHQTLWPLYFLKLLLLGQDCEKVKFSSFLQNVRGYFRSCLIRVATLWEEGWYLYVAFTSTMVP